MEMMILFENLLVLEFFRLWHTAVYVCNELVDTFYMVLATLWLFSSYFDTIAFNNITETSVESQVIRSQRLEVSWFINFYRKPESIKKTFCKWP